MRFTRMLLAAALLPSALGWAQVTDVMADFNASGDVILTWTSGPNVATYNILHAIDTNPTVLRALVPGAAAPGTPMSWTDPGVLNEYGPFSTSSHFYRVVEPSGTASKAFGVFNNWSAQTGFDTLIGMPLDRPAGTWGVASVIKSFLFPTPLSATIVDYTTPTVSVGGLPFSTTLSGVPIGSPTLQLQLGGVYLISATYQVPASNFYNLFIAGTTVDPACPTPSTCPVPLPGQNGTSGATPVYTLHCLPFVNNPATGIAYETSPFTLSGLISSLFVADPIMSSSDQVAIVWHHPFTGGIMVDPMAWHDGSSWQFPNGLQDLYAGHTYAIISNHTGTPWTWSYCGCLP